MNDEAATQPDAWTVGALLAWTKTHLQGHGVSDARLAAEVLLAHAVDCRRIELYTRFETHPDADVVGRFRDLVRRASAHEPVAYLVGEKEFYSLTFRVTADVLIPRPETELLVEYIVDRCAEKSIERPWILDIGTGSGCIAVALLSQLPGARVIASDVSAPALAIAGENAERHSVSDRMQCVEANGIELPPEVVPEGGFDIIASNPPYVSAGDFSDLDANVREYEPEIALTDGGDGCEFFRVISGARGLLRSDGAVVVEIGMGQAGIVTDLFAESGGWVHKRTLRDRVAGHERVMVFDAV